MRLCPVCISNNTGDCNVNAEVTDSMGRVVKKSMHFCFQCGLFFGEAEMTEEQKRMKKQYDELDPFK